MGLDFRAGDRYGSATFLIQADFDKVSIGLCLLRCRSSALRRMATPHAGF